MPDFKDLTFNDLRRAMNGGGLEEYQKELATYLEAIAEIDEVNGRSLIAEGLRRKEYSKSYGYDEYGAFDPPSFRTPTTETPAEIRKREEERLARIAEKAAAAEAERQRIAAEKAEAERIAREKQMEADRHYNANPVFGSL